MATSATQSRLLQLPRELRDMIYEYALTKPGGLVADVVRGLDAWTRFRAAENEEHQELESNQLRFVCRQLYVETSALGMRYNDLTFRLPDEEAFVTIYDLFDRFYHSCSATYLKDIRCITIIDDETDWPEEAVQLESLLLPSLIRFCQEFTKATVIVRFNWLEMWREATTHAPPEDIDCMIYLSLALGRPNPFPSDSGCLLGGLADQLSTHFANVQCPDNLRFSCAHIHDEEFAEQNADGVFGQEGGPDGKGARGDYRPWLEIARRVHENGV